MCGNRAEVKKKYKFCSCIVADSAVGRRSFDNFTRPHQDLPRKLLTSSTINMVSLLDEALQCCFVEAAVTNMYFRRTSPIPL